MHYPLNLSFKILAIAPQIKVTDARGASVCYVRQKLFRLKEAINVFQDESQQHKLCEIKADRLIDWSASYHFYEPSGESFGSVRRRGMRSLWSAHYEICDEAGNHYSTIKEENPMAKLADGLFGEIPVLGGFSGYFFHPKYLMEQTGGRPMMRLTKQPAFWEGKYSLEKLCDCDEVEELRGLMSYLTVALLERQRG
jgi:hypothetical protein